jgi:hypothetical protein
MRVYLLMKIKMKIQVLRISIFLLLIIMTIYVLQMFLMSQINDFIQIENETIPTNFGLFPEDVSNVSLSDRILEQLNFRPIRQHRNRTVFIANGNRFNIIGKWFHVIYN